MPALSYGIQSLTVRLTDDKMSDCNKYKENMREQQIPQIASYSERHRSNL
jgi:hypothetical protein